MHKKNSKKLFFITVVILSTAFLLSGCDNSKDSAEVDNQTDKQVEVKQDTPKESEPKKEEAKPTAEGAKEDQKSSSSDYISKDKILKQSLIEKYKAVDVSEIKNPRLSLEISRRIENSNVFLEVELHDVFLKSDKYFVKVRSYESFATIFDEFSNEPAHYIAELECPKDLADYFIKNKNDFFQFGKDFFVIAEINKVFKPSYDISASPTNNEEAEIQLDTNDTFVFRGRLVDFQLKEERTP